VYVTFAPTVADEGDELTEVDVASGPTVSANTPMDPATVDEESGVKIDVNCSGEVDTLNEVWHRAKELAAATRSATHPGIGAPLAANVIVPDGEPAVKVIAATKVTAWFVTTGDCGPTSVVVLGFGTWLRVAWPVIPAVPSFAVIVACPGVVDALIRVLYLPLRWLVVGPEVWPGSLEAKRTLSAGTGSPRASATVAVAVVKDVLSARMTGGDRVRETCVARPY
jgi:hypothetical protein